MDNWRGEWKKLCRRGGLWLLLGVLAVKVLLAAFLTLTGAQALLREDAPYIKEYIEIYGGVMNEEKRAAMIEEYTRVTGAENRIDDLWRQYDADLISYAELQEQQARQGAYLDRQSAFLAVYDLSLYVEKAPQERQLLYTDGWERLFQTAAPDVFLVAALLLLLAPVAAADRQSGMDTLLLTTRNGRRRLALIRVLFGAVLAAGIATLFFAADVCNIALWYGLSDGGCSLCSLPAFAKAPPSLTLCEAAITMLLLRAAGAVLLATMLMAAGALTGQVVSTLFVGLCAVYLPYWLWASSEWLFCLPLPTGLLMATPCATGAVSPLRLLLGGGATAVVLTLVTVSKSGGLRPRRALALLCVLMLGLCGCGSTAGGENVPSNACDLSMKVDFGDDILDCTKRPAVLISKADGSERPLQRDVFADETEVMTQVRRVGDKLYWMALSGGYAIRCMDMETFEEKTLYETSLEPRSIELFGVSVYQWLPTELDVTGAFIVHDGDVILMKTDGIYRIHGGREKRLCDQGVAMAYAYTGEVLYYASYPQRELRCYDFSSSTDTTVGDLYANSVACAGGVLWYTDPVAHNALCRLSLDTMKSETVLTQTVRQFWPAADGVWFTDSENLLYYMGADETPRRVWEEMVYTVSRTEGGVYVSTPSASCIHLTPSGESTVVYS